MWEDTGLVTLCLETAITSFSASAGRSGKLLFFSCLSFHGCPASGKCGEGLRCQQGNASTQGACSAEKALGEFFLPLFLF